MPRKPKTQNASTAKATKTTTQTKAPVKAKAPAKAKAPVKAKAPAKAKAPVKAKAPAKVDVVEQPANVRKQRYFKVIVGDGEARGRFSGTKPKQAANKALTSILKELKKDKKSTTGEIQFRIKECTRGSKYKEYNYVGQRKELAEPLEVALKNVVDSSGNPKVIRYNFENIVKKSTVGK